MIIPLLVVKSLLSEELFIAFPSSYSSSFNLQATGIQTETASRGWVTADIFVWLVVPVLCVCAYYECVLCVCDMSLYIQPFSAFSLFFFFWCRRQMSTLIIFTDNPVTGNWLATYDKVKTRLSQIKRKWNRVCREENERGVDRWEGRLRHGDSGLFDQCRGNAGGNSKPPRGLVLYLHISQRAVWEMISYSSIQRVMLEWEKQETWTNQNNSGHETAGCVDAIRTSNLPVTEIVWNCDFSIIRTGTALGCYVQPAFF